ncbi:hypothetical protein ES703_98711 [subsurface metagenome]
MRLATDAPALSSPRIALTALLPKAWRGGKRKINPAIARKLNWKAASHRIWGLIPTIMAAAKVRAVMALRCLPKSSAVRNRLAIIAPLTTGGCIPVIKA